MGLVQVEYGKVCHNNTQTLSQSYHETLYA